MISTTRGDLADIVKQYALAGGASYIDVETDTTGLNEVINRGLKEFTRKTYCLYYHSLSLIATAGIAEYSIQPIHWLETVTINGQLLRNREGKVGPESRHYIYETYPGYQTDGAGMPIHWVPLPEGIWLYPTPASGYQCYLSGFYEHPTINTSGSADNTLLSIDDSLVDLAALWISIKLKFPHIDGDDVFQKIMALDAYAGQKIRTLENRNRGRMAGLSRRRGSTRRLNS